MTPSWIQEAGIREEKEREREEAGGERRRRERERRQRDGGRWAREDRRKERDAKGTWTGKLRKLDGWIEGGRSGI